MTPRPPLLSPPGTIEFVSKDLEYPGFEVEDQVWNRLLELRGSKIHKEMGLKKQQRLFAVMKRKLEALQADCDSVDSQVRSSAIRYQYILFRVDTWHRYAQSTIEASNIYFEVCSGITP